LPYLQLFTLGKTGQLVRIIQQSDSFVGINVRITCGFEVQILTMPSQQYLPWIVKKHQTELYSRMALRGPRLFKWENYWSFIDWLGYFECFYQPEVKVCLFWDHQSSVKMGLSKKFHLSGSGRVIFGCLSWLGSALYPGQNILLGQKKISPVRVKNTWVKPLITAGQKNASVINSSDVNTQSTHL